MRLWGSRLDGWRGECFGEFCREENGGSVGEGADFGGGF